MYLNKKTVLVTGSTGLTGNAVLSKLIDHGANIKATIHNRDPLLEHPNIEYIRCDLTQYSDCEKVVEGVNCVIHCAANTSGAATASATPMVHVTPNVVMNSQLLETAYQSGVEKFLWLSSTTRYPTSGDHPVSEEEILEGEPYSKYFFVGWMKRFTEILCQMYGEKLPRPMTTIVIRPTNIYGPNDDYEPETSHVTAALIRKVIERQTPIEVWGTGEDVRDVIYVDDMAEAIVTALNKVNSYSAFNIGLGEAYSINTILQTILDIDGYDTAEIITKPDMPTMIPIRLVNVNKARDVLGFQAKTSLREGLEKTISWYRQTHDLPKS